MKRVSLLPVSEPCVECGAGADEKCASWCLARVLDDEEDATSDDFDGDDFDGDDEVEEPAHQASAS